MGDKAKDFARYLYHSQLQTIGLIIAQVILLILGVANVLSLFLSSPIVIALALITSYILYTRQSGEAIRKILRDLRRHVEEFARVNFDPKKDREDFRVIKLLDMITFPPQSSQWPREWAEAFLLGQELRNLQLVFQLWHSNIKDNVIAISRKGTSFLEYDLGKVVEAFAIFYSSYLDLVAERILLMLNEIPTLPKDQEIKSMLNVYRENLGHLRERVNSFLMDFHESGHDLQVREVKALKTELVGRVG